MWRKIFHNFATNLSSYGNFNKIHQQSINSRSKLHVRGQLSVRTIHRVLAALTLGHSNYFVAYRFAFAEIHETFKSGVRFDNVWLQLDIQVFHRNLFLKRIMLGFWPHCVVRNVVLFLELSVPSFRGWFCKFALLVRSCWVTFLFFNSYGLTRSTMNRSQESALHLK